MVIVAFLGRKRLLGEGKSKFPSSPKRSSAVRPVSRRPFLAGPCPPRLWRRTFLFLNSLKAGSLVWEAACYNLPWHITEASTVLSNRAPSSRCLPANRKHR